MEPDWIRLAVRRNGQTINHRDRVLYRGAPLGDQVWAHPEVVGFANFQKKVWPVYRDGEGIHFIELTTDPLRSMPLLRRLIHN
jgi:hypothetical protein